MLLSVKDTKIRKLFSRLNKPWKDKWLKKCLLPMAITEDNITDDIYATAKLSIDYIKVKTGMRGVGI